MPLPYIFIILLSISGAGGLDTQPLETDTTTEPTATLEVAAPTLIPPPGYASLGIWLAATGDASVAGPAAAEPLTAPTEAATDQGAVPEATPTCRADSVCVEFRF